MVADRARLASLALPAILAVGITRAAHQGFTAAGDDPPAAMAAVLSEARARVSVLEARVLELEASLEDERRQFARRERELELHVRALQEELVHEAEERFAREQEWLGFTRTLATLASGSLAPGELAQLLRGPVSVEEDSAGEDAVQATEASAGDLSDVVLPPEVIAGLNPVDPGVKRRLRALLAAEDLSGFEVLETGFVADGATGPVVLRVSDENGTPVGSLTAERLRLEASRSGRALCIVLEDGYERRGGMRYPFEGEDGGERRISLPHIDPGPWIEALPALFRFEDTGPLVDDGRFNLSLVRRALNVMFDEDIAAGHYRLVGLGGVVGADLCDVQVDQLDAQGHLLRSLVADRMTIETQSSGVLLRLADGVQIRGGRKVAFLDGRYRIYLPQADAEVWTELGLPGLVAYESSPLARDSGLALPRRLVK